jgi:hypothetical protein
MIYLKILEKIMDSEENVIQLPIGAEVEEKGSHSFYILMLFLVILNNGITNLYTTIWGDVIFVTISFYIAYKNKIGFYDGFIKYFTIAYALITLYYFYDFGFVMLSSVKFYLKILSIYYLLKHYKLRFLTGFHDVVYILGIISLPLFLLQLINYDLLYNFMKLINIAPPEATATGWVHFVIFTIDPSGMQRNSGFMWEPGAFGAFIAIALIINVIINDFRFNKKLFVFFFVAITTLSTTVYLVMFLIILTLVIKTSIKYLLLMIPIIIVSVILFLTLPFLGEKILITFYNQENYMGFIENQDIKDGKSIGRYAGAMIELNNFVERPILGWGFQQEYKQQGLVDFSNPNGLSVLLGKFGVVGFLFFFISAFLSFKNLSFDKNIQPVLFILILIIISISNPLETNLFFLMFPLYYYSIKEPLVDE